MDLRTLLTAVVSWAEARADVVGLALVGSQARGSAGPEADVDLIILTDVAGPYFPNDEWLSLFGDVKESKVESWGRVETLRAFYTDGSEIEFNFAALDWARVPVDPGTSRVISEGMRILYDPNGRLEALRKAVSFGSSMNQPMSTQTTCRVLANYQAAYPDPIIVRAGEELVIGKEDPDYPGWIWCTDLNGKGGWVPDDFIERTEGSAKARYDYEATELSASVGEELIITKAKGGWAWCINRNGQSGWLPVANLERENTD